VNLGEWLWFMLALFFWAMAIWIFIQIFADIFRRRDLSGGAKAGWILLIFVLPFFGCLIYLAVRPSVSGQVPEDARMQDARPVQTQT
jgi:hypothetical protein